MEITLESRLFWILIAIIALLTLIGFGLIGHLITPVEAGEAVILTPARWTAFRLTRQARKETERLVKDAERLQALLKKDAADPVEAMLLAQRIYANHNTGSSATRAARMALINAAEAAARAATGELPRQDAIFAFQEALSRIQPLTQPSPSDDGQANVSPTSRSYIFTPFVTVGGVSPTPTSQ